MARRVDLNRQKKIYPYIRRKPIFRVTGKDNKFDYVVEPDANVYSIHEIDSGNSNFIQQEELNIFDFGDGKTGLFGFSFSVDQSTNLHEVAITLSGISDASNSEEIDAENSASDLLFEFDTNNSDYIVPKA